MQLKQAIGEFLESVAFVFYIVLLVRLGLSLTGPGPMPPELHIGQRPVVFCMYGHCGVAVPLWPKSRVEKYSIHPGGDDE
jgi:hypothetical protein